jgi:hypothetical protein
MMSKTIAPLLLVLAATTANAKLPTPSDEAKAKAAEAAAKTAHAGKVDNYKLCLAMDKVAAGYHAAAKKAGKAASAATETPACADPGPFVAAPAGAAPAPVVTTAATAPAAATKK